MDQEMATPQLLDAAIPSDGGVREAPYTLLCMVVAVEKADEVSEDVWEIYQYERDVSPFEHLLQASDDFSMHMNSTRKKLTLKHRQKVHGEGELKPQTSSVRVQADLQRLLSSTSSDDTQRRLEDQLESLRVQQILETTGILLPRHLQITTLEEDPLEFRRDTHGIAQLWGRNILGEHYAPKSDQLRFLHSHSVPEIFKRMKRVVRDDLSTRNKRRIAALNAKEKERKKELEKQGILSPEQQLEAKFDRLLNPSVA
ncbi:hypothetical protein P3T76_007755 [Phytophthora citrophthora]|uniref:Uncharacterized protein n=1 Tax=Phytophthora citrophthora TaxID=4793 RepID=A0AAD9LND9_9STRA|nr:hypothetical protein P3T76_007755 [Phytophthora citrophthora]